MGQRGRGRTSAGRRRQGRPRSGRKKKSVVAGGGAPKLPSVDGLQDTRLPELAQPTRPLENCPKKKFLQKTGFPTVFTTVCATVCTTFENLCFSSASLGLAITTFLPSLSADRPGFRNCSCSVEAALPSHRKSGACDTGGASAAKPHIVDAFLVVGYCCCCWYCCCIEVRLLLLH